MATNAKEIKEKALPSDSFSNIFFINAKQANECTMATIPTIIAYLMVF